MRRLSARRFASVLAIVALLAVDSSAHQVRPRHEEQISAADHSHVLASTASTRRPLTVVQQRSLFAARLLVSLPAHALVPPRVVRRLAPRPAIPLPPARMRYRRSTHEADGEPPA
jgi:hypothetical protein